MTRLPHRRLIPNFPSSHEEHQRYVHADIPDLTSDEMWAEIQILTAELASIIFQRGRGRVTTEEEWIRERLSHLRNARTRKAA
jgi:hypothetical protein